MRWMLIRSIDYSFFMGQNEPTLYHVDLDSSIDGDGVDISVSFPVLPKGREPGILVWMNERGQPAPRLKPRLTLGGNPIVEESTSTAPHNLAAQPIEGQ